MIAAGAEPQAKREELLTDPHELPATHKRVLEEQQQKAQQAAIELRVIEKRLKYLSDTAEELQGADSPHTFELDALTVERLSVEAERVYLQALVDATSKQGSTHRD